MEPTIHAAIDLLEKAVEQIAAEHLSARVQSSTKNLRALRLSKENRVDACILKAGCIVTNLRGTSILVDAGWVHEAGTLFRQANELQDDIWFLLENPLSEPDTNQQRKFLESFFSELVDDPEDVSGTVVDQSRVSRSKVHSGTARLLASKGAGDFSTNQVHLSALFKLYSAYSHASYPTLMDGLFQEQTGSFTIAPKQGRLQTASKQNFQQMLIGGVMAIAFLADRLEMQELFLRLHDVDLQLRSVLPSGTA